MFRRKPDPAPVYAKDMWHEQHVQWPLERTLLASVPGFEEFKRRPLTEIAPDYRKPDSAGCKVWLPPWVHVSSATKALIVSIVSTRLGIDDPVATWVLAGPQPSVTVRPRAAIPEVVRWPSLSATVQAAPETTLVAGVGLGGQLVTVDLALDSPHLGVSGDSGSGKSVLLQALLAQALHKGAVVVMLDMKRHSHRWCQGLPNVLYCKDVAHIHDTMVLVGKEVQRRNEVADDPDADVGPRVLTVLEEANATADLLAQYWAELRAPGDPKRSPALTALAFTLFTGRAVRANVVVAAQQLRADAVAGGAARENLGVRLLGGATEATWRMLAPEVRPVPPKPRVKGRWRLVTGGELTEFQSLWATDEEARAWAAGGRGELPTSLVVPGPSHIEYGPDREKPVGRVLTRRLVGLRDGVAELPGDPMTLHALRKAAQRDLRFPMPVDEEQGKHLYDPADLARWKAGRDAARAIPAAGEQRERTG